MKRTRPHPRAAEGERTRKEILRVALELFAEHGYTKTTITQIADRANTYRSSVDWHFGSKEGLLLAVVDNFLSDELPGFYLAEFDEYKGQNPEAVEADILREFAHQAILRLFECHYEAIMALFRVTLEEMPNNDKLAETVKTFWQATSDDLASVIKRGQKKGNLSDQLNPEWTARAILAIMQGLFMQLHLERDREKIRPLTDGMMSAVTRLLLLDQARRDAVA